MMALDVHDERESFLQAQQCPERESGGYQCELPADHFPETSHACPQALKAWLKSRSMPALILTVAR
jgi:hypothetical protein